MFVALGIQHETRIRHIVICGLYGYSIVPHYLINDTIKKINCWKQNVCFDFLYNFCLKHF